VESEKEEEKEETLSPIKFEAKVYKTEKRAMQKFKELVDWDKSVHPDWRRHPHKTFYPKYNRWVISWSYVYPERRRRRRKKR